MLQLQRASAGSGKTYMLAKKFIEYFISVKDEGGNRRLRRPQELRDALCHILAITFTNKATNEMKLRIVDKLDALSRWTPDVPIKKVDYLAEFSDCFHCNPQDVAILCLHALKTLLSDYGDFKVSTIDSFFQTVLRTFAFEADLDDTYQIELDSNYVIQMGLDTTLDEIETNDDDSSSDGLAWVNDMMEKKASSGRGWNIFQKQATPNSIYSQVLKASGNLAREDFKEIREQLDAYFEENPDFYATYNKLCHFYEHDVREKHAAMQRAARAVRKAFSDAGLDMYATAGTYLAGRVDKMAQTWDWNYSDKKLQFKIPEMTRKGPKNRVFDPRVDNPCLNGPVEDEIEALVVEMYGKFDEWRTEVFSDKLKRWRIYSATMPYVGLLQSVRGNARLFLTDSNTVELGETNSILNRIIGDDDAPFIYERIGNRLEHFLIDEFQDTSRLQWNNLRPLLAESEGKGNDNLIIGDAKQSIYRFRNADPSLITRKVPEQFASSCRECGNTPAENTNWRSSRRIVEFNNLFFRFFTSQLSPEMERLYANTVQPPHNTDDYGYVKVQLFISDSKADVPEHFARIPELIADMLRRGYAMRDIAVLVDTKEQGSQIIDSIMAYNHKEDTGQKIDFISADSLQVGESTAVQAIVSILEAVNNGTRAKLRPKEEWAKKCIGDWSKMKADFGFFAQQNPDTPLSGLLSRFLKGEYNPNAIREMLDEMSTAVLPALVENIIRHFISRRVRESEAPFIAAFQDCVLEFCEGYSADVTSFLSWWNNKGRHRSISSPEDADAVQIMTVHKSKGLEFRCVIVPYSKQTIAPVSSHEREWLWVQPDLHEVEDIAPIPWIPVWSDALLADTLHAGVYGEYLQKYLVDKVNMAYVAYTRAVDELYIFTPCNVAKDGTVATGKGRIGEYLWRCGEEGDEIINEIAEACPSDLEYIPPMAQFDVDPESLSWSYGDIPDREEVLKKSDSLHKKEEGVHVTPISQYYCSPSIPSLLYADPASPDDDVLPLEIESTDDDTESEEVRAYGELMHSIMEFINIPDDIQRVLLRMKTRGFINRREEEKYKKEINDAIEGVSQYGWFEPGLKVINERAIASRGKMLRPDRIIFREDGTAVIVDYKFGTHRNDKSYSRQLARYAKALVASGKASRCDTYIWYVTLNKVVKALPHEISPDC